MEAVALPFSHGPFSLKVPALGERRRQGRQRWTPILYLAWLLVHIGGAVMTMHMDVMVTNR
jgi:hypothetical protein